MSKEKVALKDIAKELNVSVDTVSKALRDSNQISETTKQKIKEKAEEMGYVKNSFAVALKTGKSNNYVIYLNSLYNPYFSIMANYFIKELEANNCRGIICFADGYLLQKENLSSVLTNQSPAVISLIEPTDEAVKFLNEQNIPLYVVGLKPKQKGVNYAITDDYSGGYKIGEFFACSSFKKALFVTNSPSETSHRRRKGFIDAVTSLSNKQFISLPFENEKEIFKEAGKIIQNNKIDFVFCFSDYLAFILRALLHKEYKNYDTVIFGFDDLASYIDAFEPVNSVSSNVSQIVKDVIESVLRYSETGKKEKFQKQYPVKLVIK